VRPEGFAPSSNAGAQRPARTRRRNSAASAQTATATTPRTRPCVLVPGRSPCEHGTIARVHRTASRITSMSCTLYLDQQRTMKQLETAIQRRAPGRCAAGPQLRRASAPAHAPAVPLRATGTQASKGNSPTLPAFAGRRGGIPEINHSSRATSAGSAAAARRRSRRNPDCGRRPDRLRNLLFGIALHPGDARTSLQDLIKSEMN